MPTMLCTGATGFLGQHVVYELRKVPNLRVLALGRNKAALQALGCEYHACALEDITHDDIASWGSIDSVLHMAWDDLDNYRSYRHIEHHLFVHHRFLSGLLQAGVSDLTITGTCLEYGMVNGCLREEDVQGKPSTAYAVAKDALRRLLEEHPLLPEHGLRWLRLFYTYGKGQRSQSLLPLLKAALRRGDPTFPMSGGEQLRDYVPVSRLAQLISQCALQHEISGIINCCSGQPRSVRSLVEETVAQHQATIELDLGCYPYPNYEGMAFWGDPSKLKRALLAYSDREK